MRVRHKILGPWVTRGARGRIVAKDEAGKVYGKLTVLRSGPAKLMKNGKPDKCAIWVCQCECGNTALIRGQSLRSGNSQSCGCERIAAAVKRLSLPVGVSALNRAMETMRANAKRRNIPWDLTLEQTKSLLAENCHYCGSLPANTSRGRNGHAVYSGIDRINNACGYDAANVVPCCIKCNTAKLDLTLDDFRAWVKTVHNRLFPGEV